MSGFNILDEELHSKANKYIEDHREILLLWEVREIKLIKIILDRALMDDLLEEDDGVKETKELLELWNWEDLPSELDSENRYYIFESLLMKVRPGEYGEKTRKYVQANWDRLETQYNRDGEILYIDDTDFIDGITARRANYIFKIMKKERNKNALQGLKEGWVTIKNE